MKINRFKITTSIAIVLCAILIGITSNLSAPPNLLHQWRQCDGLSMSINYYEEGLDFFNPQIHFQHSHDGRAVGEFPILYYSNAILWKCFGHSHLVSRLLNLSIFLIGLYFLSLTSFILTKDKFLSICVPLLVLSSPLIARYAPAFLPNTTALSFLFISIYYFAQHYEDKNRKALILCVVFAALSALLRTTMLIGFVPLIAIALVSKFDYKRLLVLASPLFAVLLWVLYIKSYNSEYGSVYFLTKITPVWEMSGEEISLVWDQINLRVKSNVMSSFLFVSLLIFAFYIIKSWRKIGNILLLYIGLVFLATVAYFILWFKKLGVHDYYFIELFILVPSIVILLGKLGLKRNHFTVIILAAATVFSITVGAIRHRFIHSPSQHLNPIEQIVLKGSEVSYWNWFHDNYNQKFKAFESAQTFIRDLGIQREDLVFSIQDPSPNITLYLLDVKGYTALYQHNKSYDQQIESMKEKGVKYLITLDNSVLNEISEGFVGEHLGTYQNIDVFSLRN